MDFAGKSILVTGASRGIGAAIAQAFAAEGAAVTVNYLANAEAAAASVAACEAVGGDAIAVQADVTDREEAFSLVEQAVDTFGKVDVLVNNAFRPYRFDPEQRKLHWELDWADYQAQFEGAVKSAHGLAQAVLPSMLARAEGSIVNIATDLVARPTVPYHEYTTAKAALIGFSRNSRGGIGADGRAREYGRTRAGLSNGGERGDEGIREGCDHRPNAAPAHCWARRISSGPCYFWRQTGPGS